MIFELSEVLARARECVALEVPHVHRGQTISGMDCVGLVVYAFKYAGNIPLYGRDPHAGVLVRELRRVFGPPVDAEPQSGDIVAMRWGGDVRHVGIIAQADDGRATIIHSIQSVGRATEHGLDEKTRKRIKHVFRPEFR